MMLSTATPLRTSMLSISCGLVAILLPSCGAPPAPDEEPIDFAGAAKLATMVFDLSNTAGITDDALADIYGGEDIDILVRSVTFAGDDSPSRYMFFKNHRTRTQTIALSGTNSATLWEFNFDFESVYEPDLDCRVHRGFNKIALTVMDDVLPRLELDYPVTITGYSLGGAMAVILANYLNLNGYEVIDVVTFGQPKFTDQEGAHSFETLPITRFMNVRDPVPRLPPGDFSHFGEVIVLSEGSDFARLSSNEGAFDTATSGRLLDILFTMRMDDHGTYPVNLEAKAVKAREVSYEQLLGR